MKKRSKEEKREEKEEKKGRKIPLRNYTKGGRKSSVIAGVNILLFILAVVISILKKGNAGTEPEPAAGGNNDREK